MDRQRFRGALLLCALLSAIASAPAGEVDVDRSRIYVFVGKTGAGHEHAVEGLLSKGDLDLTRAQRAGSLSFDLKSLSADTPAARKVLRLPGETDADTRTQVTANMLGGTVLDAAKFPTAELLVQKVQAVEVDRKEREQPYQIEGELTLHGVKRPVRFNATAAAVEGMTRLRGNVELKQTDYGIRPYSKLLGAVGVKDELRIFGEIWIRP